VEAPDATAEPRRRSTFTSRALILLLVLAVLGVSYASSIRAWLNLRSEQHLLTAQIAERKAAIASMKGQVARWNDPAYIEMAARQRFGWVMPGEHSYRVIGKNGKVLGDGTDVLAGSSLPSDAAQPPWWSGIAGSLAKADAPPPEPSRERHREPAKRIGPPGGTSGR